MINFEAVLVLVTLLTGVTWAFDKRRRRRGYTGGMSWWVDFSRSVFPVILAVLVIRSFIIEPFRIPSGSMMPTLEAGDFIVVNKFGYGLRLPVGRQLIVPMGNPERGDVAVFRYPVDPSQDYIKRVVGLPGDELVYRNKQLSINGEPVPTKALGRWQGDPEFLLREEQIGEISHQLLVFDESGGREFSFEVPADHYFVMGDNRDRSSDSRFWGPVHRDHFVGEAFFIWMSWNGGINWGRLGQRID